MIAKLVSEIFAFDRGPFLSDLGVDSPPMGDKSARVQRFRVLTWQQAFAIRDCQFSDRLCGWFYGAAYRDRTDT
jgi:hypothetical protein